MPSPGRCCTIQIADGGKQKLAAVSSAAIAGVPRPRRAVRRKYCSDRRSTADLAKEITALKLHNAKLQATLDSTAGLDDHLAGQVSHRASPSNLYVTTLGPFTS